MNKKGILRVQTSTEDNNQLLCEMQICNRNQLWFGYIFYRLRISTLAVFSLINLTAICWILTCMPFIGCRVLPISNTIFGASERKTEYVDLSKIVWVLAWSMLLPAI